MLDALSDPTRRIVFERLRAGPMAVGEVAASLPVSRPAVSQHLGVLASAGLVSHHREGTRNIYRIEPDGLARLRTYIEGVWEDALSRLRDIAEGEA